MDQPETRYCLWWPCLFMDQDESSILYIKKKVKSVQLQESQMELCHMLMFNKSNTMVPVVKQELLTLSGAHEFTPDFSGVCVA